MDAKELAKPGSGIRKETREAACLCRSGGSCLEAVATPGRRAKGHHFLWLGQDGRRRDSDSRRSRQETLVHSPTMDAEVRRHRESQAHHDIGRSELERVTNGIIGTGRCPRSRESKR